MEFYIAGYYLIQGSQKKNWMDEQNLLPSNVWSGSRHICAKFPDAWVLGWLSSREVEAEREREDAREMMKLSLDEFSAAQKDFNELIQGSQFAFPNVFMDSDIAMKKYHQYFSLVPDLKLLGLGLPETYIESFFDKYNTNGFDAVTHNGVYIKLNQKETYKGNSLIGYDLLGYDGGDYCSFLCGSMESEIYEKYGVRYNSYGLISEYEQAEKVSQAIANGEETAEDGFWAPWLVFEIKT
jgi:hypothetical protein